MYCPYINVVFYNNQKIYNEPKSMAGKKMVSRKTQVALFFIFGLVIIIAVSFLNYIASESAKSGIKASREIVNVAEMPASLLPVKLNIDLCMEEIAEQAVTYTGLYGGYYKVPEPKLAYFFDDVPYYVYYSENTMPSTEEIQSQISQYVKEQLPECINGLEFEDAELEGEINFVDASIGDGKVVVNADYPITISRLNSKTKVEDLRAEVPVRLDTIYKIASSITEGKISDGALCIDCLIDLASENNVFIDIVSHEDSLIFTIFDNVTKVNDDDYIFSFAMEK